MAIFRPLVEGVNDERTNYSIFILDVDAKNCKGSTACQIALNQGYDELAQFPVEQGAKKKSLSIGLLRTVRTTIHIALVLRCNA